MTPPDRAPRRLPLAVADLPGGAALTARSTRVLMILPPDFEAPLVNRRMRFPAQGPALVAGSIAPDGFVVRAVDLDLSTVRDPPRADLAVLSREDRVLAHLAGTPDDELVALARELLDRAGSDCDAFAFSLDRHTQIRLAAVLALEAKRRHGKPVILGGANASDALVLLQRLGTVGLDVVTAARTPYELRFAFRALRELGPDRWEPPVDPVPMQGMAATPDEWPAPDYSIYDLDEYRRDPFTIEPFPGYDGSGSPRLILPYHFTYDCQYRCSFCQRGGTQTAKSMDRVVRDFAALAERHDTRDFMLFNAQVNLYAAELARSLIAARLDVRWTDSYRVAPSKPGVMELLARSGCVGLTFGVESASERVLKSMIKGHRPAEATRVIHEADESEIMVRVNLLPCFPGETRAELEETRDWVQAHAMAIDDLAPSSFYLAEGSPLGQNPEKHGIRIRGQRALDGDYKFRKNLGSLEFDEVGGMTWEERAPTLRTAEEELRAAWQRGRGARGRIHAMQTPTMFAARARFDRKADGYPTMLRWLEGGAPSPGAPPPSLAARPVRLLAPLVRPQMLM